jgi:hypothetical protein
MGVALDLALKRIVELSGDDTRYNIEGLRDEAIRTFKNADVPPQRDLDHVRIVSPAIELLLGHFQCSLDELPLPD